jgi:hypothetical protein
MSQKNITILKVALIIAALMVTFPPWVFKEAKGAGLFLAREAGYICVFTPPSTQEHKRMARLFGYEDDVSVPQPKPESTEHQTPEPHSAPAWREVNGKKILTLDTSDLQPASVAPTTGAQKIAGMELFFRVSVDWPRLFLQLIALFLVTTAAILVIPRHQSPEIGW